MSVSSKHHVELAPERQAIRDKTPHPLARRSESRQEEYQPSIPQRLENLARQFGERVALTGPSDNSLTYARLFDQIRRTVDALNEIGIGRGDHVALLLPDGVQMALAFLGVSAAASCAPVNPSSREHELETIFSNLRPKALVVEAGTGSAAVTVAERNSIPIIELTLAGNNRSNRFTLRGEPLAPTKPSGLAQSADAALILFTSGTTARPKLVPLTHANLLASADNIAATLELSPDDRCLNIMPLFHIHGLVGGLLASLVSGASVVCPPGFNAPQFFHWLTELQPTWYSAVPTMHQLIVGRARANGEIIKNHHLRFIRSSSAALPARVMTDLESLFAAPVIESYGMTEAAHQMTSNPLPPGLRKPGSVGKAAGPEIAIMDEAGNLQPAGTVGEVVIRGANVMLGYADNGDANAAAFTHGWFRTGDQGYLDGDGYLFLTGRIKELINRGGEKISPREIDDVLMAHPAVERAVAFAVSHSTLGEEVAAAVELKPGARTSARQLMAFVATKLADFKVPKQIVMVDDIPKSPTGKLQRIGLAEKLGITAIEELSSDVRAEYEPPKTELEERIADIWAKVLKVQRIGRHDNFFHLGGHSLLAIQLVREVEQRLAKSIAVATLLKSPTLAEFASAISEQNNAAPSPLISIQPNGSKPPFFCAHGTDSYVELAGYLGPDQPFYGLAQHLEGRRVRHSRIEDIAAHYLREIRTVQPKGPYYIGGHSFGGLIAFEMAQQLQQLEQEIALLVLLDTRPPQVRPTDTNGTSAHSLDGQNLNSFSMRSLKRKLYFVRQRVKAALRKDAKTVACEVYYRIGWSLPPSLQMFYVDQVVYGRIYAKAHRSYVPQSYTGRAVYFKSEDADERVDGWKKFVTQGLAVHSVPGDHLSMLAEPNLKSLAQTLKKCLAEAQKSACTSAQSCKVSSVAQREETPGV